MSKEFPLLLWFFQLAHSKDLAAATEKIAPEVTPRNTKAKQHQGFVRSSPRHLDGLWLPVLQKCKMSFASSVCCIGESTFSRVDQINLNLSQPSVCTYYMLRLWTGAVLWMILQEEWAQQSLNTIQWDWESRGVLIPMATKLRHVTSDIYTVHWGPRGWCLSLLTNTKTVPGTFRKIITHSS